MSTSLLSQVTKSIYCGSLKIHFAVWPEKLETNLCWAHSSACCIISLMCECVCLRAHLCARTKKWHKGNTSEFINLWLMWCCSTLLCILSIILDWRWQESRPFPFVITPQRWALFTGYKLVSIDFIHGCGIMHNPGYPCHVAISCILMQLQTSSLFLFFVCVFQQSNIFGKCQKQNSCFLSFHMMTVRKGEVEIWSYQSL